MDNLTKELFDSSLVISKVSPANPKLFVHKYHRKVFFDNLWNQNKVLLEARGTITTQDRVVVRPFAKVFNRGENKTDLHRDMKVTAIRKVNGFMGVYTYDPEFGEIYSTTGSMTSDFVGYIKDKIEHIVHKQDNPRHQSFAQYVKSMNPLLGNVSFIFEICHENDPHIIDEELGAYLIGARVVSDGQLLSELVLDAIAKEFGFKRPEVIENILFGDVVKLAKECQHEGFMIRDAESVGPILLKLKSPYYLMKKFIMRATARAIFSEKYKTLFDEEFYPIIQAIQSRYTSEQWVEFDKAQRTRIAEGIIYGHYN